MPHSLTTARPATWVQRGIQPNTVVYNALISALGVCGQWQAALDTFQVGGGRFISLGAGRWDWACRT